ncbi:unnamed protein product [Rotaria sp. Silwood2]|nr:unnamed protein product [Rotaria sp. Silwood2]
MIFDEVLMNKDDFLTNLTQLVTDITHSMRASWGGAIKALRLMASDDNIDVKWSHVYVVSSIRVRPYQRSATSTAFVIPSVNF